MGNFKRNIGIILSGAVIATNSNVVVTPYALEKDVINQESKLDSGDNQAVFEEKNIISVESEEDLIAALENPSIKTVNIKKDIDLSKDVTIGAAGENKKIRGNGYKISCNPTAWDIAQINTDLVKNIDIENLELNKVSINADNANVNITKNSKLNNMFIESMLNENININNSTIENADIRGSFRGGKVEIQDVQIKDSRLGLANGEVKNVQIQGNKGSKYKTAINIDNSLKEGAKVELEAIKISNPGDHGIISNSENVVLKGNIEIEGSNKEAILMQAGKKNKPNKLYIEGNIKQIGDTYTIRAEKEGVYTKVYDKNNTLKKGIDKRGDSYYNTNNRIGNEPELPNFEATDNVDVIKEEDLISALENPNIKTIEIRSDIDLSKEVIIGVYGETKKIKGNGYKISCNPTVWDIAQINTDSVENIDIENVELNKVSISADNANVNITKNSKLNNMFIESMLNGNININNSTIENADIRGSFRGGKVEIQDVQIKDSRLGLANGEVKNVQIQGNKGTKYKAAINIKNSLKEGAKVELEAIKISKPGDHGIISNSENVVLKGNIEIEGSNKEAVLIQAGKKNKPNKLYIEGKIKQIGDTYTIRAEKEGVYTKVYDKNNTLKKGIDKIGDSYYNTNNRIGNEPELPNFEEPDNVDVSKEEDLISALENPNIKTIEIKSNIDLSKNTTIGAAGENKKIRGNGYKISCNPIAWDIAQINTDLVENIDIENVELNKVSISADNTNVNITKNSKLNNMFIESMMNGNININNSTIENADIRGSFRGGKVEIQDVQIKDSRLGLANGEVKNVQIQGNKGSKCKTAINIDNSLKEGAKVELEAIKISNPGDHGIISNSENVVLKGNIEIEGSNKEAILIQVGKKNKPNKLYIEGNIKQIGDTYTIKAEKEGVYTKIYDKNKLFKKGTNLKGDTFYIHKDRDDIEVPKAINNVTDKSTKIFGYAEPNQIIRVKNSTDNRVTDTIGECETDSKGRYEIDLSGKELNVGEKLDIFIVEESNEEKALTIDVKTKKEDIVQNSIDDKTNTILGTSNPGTLIVVRVNGIVIEKTTVDETGKYSINIPNQTSGTVINISFIDEEGNETANFDKKVITSTSTGGGGSVGKPTVTENKLVGLNRYQTAIKISNKGWSQADNIVIVNSNSIVDALSATPFARLKNAPILLTQEDKLNNETKQEILRLKPKNIYIVGGNGSVSNSVIDELKSLNLLVERISGDDRYSTSLEIAKKLGDVSEIAVVNGVTGLSDAVSIAPVAANNKMPIVLVSPNDGTKVFDKYIQDENIIKSFVIGNEASLSDEVANKVPNSERLGGKNRNETNAVISERFFTRTDLNNIFVAKDGIKKQDDLIDALSVGVLASKQNSPVIIVGNDLDEKQEKLLSKKKPKVITQVGGNGNENSFNKLVKIFKK